MASPPDGSHLCLHCGLCCQGVLHTHVVTTSADARRLKELGLPVESFGDHTGFRLPCPLYKDHRCSVYPPGLHSCASYQCEVLVAYLAGHLSLRDSLALVVGARALLIDPDLPENQSFEQVRVAVRQMEDRVHLLPTPEAQAAHYARQAAVNRLEHFLRQHFKK